MPANKFCLLKAVCVIAFVFMQITLHFPPPTSVCILFGLNKSTSVYVLDLLRFLNDVLYLVFFVTVRAQLGLCNTFERKHALRFRDLTFNLWYFIYNFELVSIN